MSETMVVTKSVFNRLILSLVFAIALSAFFGGYLLGSEDGHSEIILGDISAQGSEQKQTSKQTLPSSSLVFVSSDDDPFKGNPDAHITIIEFSDFQCPFCAQFHSSTLPQIQKNYVDTGKVKFVYRDFPITSIHPNAVPAAVAAECANEQGLFWQYHDKLFENQNSWERLVGENVVNEFKEYAADLGLITSQFNDCFDSAKYLEEVTQDLQDGMSYGVTGTPGFFIGNDQLGFTQVSGAQPYSVFQRVFDQQLVS